MVQINYLVFLFEGEINYLVKTHKERTVIKLAKWAANKCYNLIENYCVVQKMICNNFEQIYLTNQILGASP